MMQQKEANEQESIPTSCSRDQHSTTGLSHVISKVTDKSPENEWPLTKISSDPQILTSEKQPGISRSSHIESPKHRQSLNNQQQI